MEKEKEKPQESKIYETHHHNVSSNGIPALKIFHRKTIDSFIAEEWGVESSSWTMHDAIIGLDTAIDRMKHMEIKENVKTDTNKTKQGKAGKAGHYE